MNLSGHHLLFRLKCADSKDSAFQKFFERIMQKHDKTFVPVKPAGPEGDWKCDGYSAASKTVYQCYSPNELRSGKTSRKIRADFAGAMEKWGAEMERWTFVWNSDALPPQVVKVLAELSSSDDSKITIDQFGPERLWTDVVSRLSSENLNELLGQVPGSVSAESLNRMMILADEISSECADDDFHEVVSEKDFLVELTRFKDVADKTEKLKIIDYLFYHSWSSILYNQNISKTTLNEVLSLNHELADAVRPVCIWRERDNVTISADHIASCVLSLCGRGDQEYQPNGNHQILVYRVIKRAIYNFPAIFGNSLVIEAIRNATGKCSLELWDSLMYDLFLRFRGGFSNIPNELLDLLNEHSELYNLRYSESVLAKVYKFQMAQYGSVDHELLDASQIYEMAKRSRNSVEAAWVVKTAQINGCLVDGVEEVDAIKTDGLSFAERTLNLVPTNVRKESSYLRGFEVVISLKAFAHKSDSVALLRFERCFTEAKKYLHPNQVEVIQCEFASLLLSKLRLLQGEYQPWMVNTSLADLVESDNVARASHPLFVNRYTRNDPTVSSRRSHSFSKWLSIYLGIVRKQSIIPAVQRQPTFIYRMRHFRKCPYNRGGDGFISILEEHIRKIAFHLGEVAPEYCCRIMPMIYFLECNINTDRGQLNSAAFMRILEKCFDAPDFYLIINDLGIANTIHKLSLYVYHTDDELATKLFCLAQRMSDVLKRKIYPGGMAEAYLGIVLWNQMENDFMKSLADALADTIEEKRDETNDNVTSVRVGGIYVPVSDLIKITNGAINSSSLIAKSFGSDFSNPELWNILGTTIEDRLRPQTATTHIAAACCYAQADYLAKSLDIVSAKYRFNYMNSYGESLALSDQHPSFGEVEEDLNFVFSQAAVEFHYKEERIIPWLKMLRKNWSRLARVKIRFHGCERDIESIFNTPAREGGRDEWILKLGYKYVLVRNDRDFGSIGKAFDSH